MVRFFGTTLITGIYLLPAKSLSACSVCFGNADQKTLLSLRYGIFVLLGIVLTVLIGIAAFFMNMARRQKLRL